MISKARVMALAEGDSWLATATNLLYFGPPGSGKSHSAAALGRALVDITYVTKDQAESSVLFELISARYERRSLLITANQPFSEWGKIFPGEAMTLAAVDRLVHHSIIFELNVESYRRKTALSRKTNAANPISPPTSDASS